MTMKTYKRNQDTTMTAPLTRLGWASLVLVLATQEATGFQSARQLRVSPPGYSLRSLSTGTEYDNQSTRPKSRRASLVPTRLQYREGNDDSTATVTPRKWWFNIFPAEQDEQDNVDEYLEFLDRRYKRMHRIEKNEEETKPFSAMDWLLTPSRNNVITTQQQEEDALYVLGVAGLASQKLLHKHRKAAEEKVAASTTVTLTKPSQRTKTMNIFDAEVEESNASAVLIKKVLVPFIRVIYMTQRRKDLFISSQLNRAKTLGRAALRRTANSMVHGPIATTKAFLEVGGGRKMIAFTFSTAMAVFLLLQPILQAAITEATVSP